jgi:hypothetical protein
LSWRVAGPGRAVQPGRRAGRHPAFAAPADLWHDLWVGAHTGGASILLGGLLLAIGLVLGDSVALLFRLFPPAVLGVILLLAGMQLALNGRTLGLDKLERHVVLITAAFAIWRGPWA